MTMGIFDFLKKNKNIENDNGINEIYHNNGKGELQEIFTKKNGKIHGLLKGYYKSGGLRGESEYKEGKREGEFKSFYESGQIRIKGNFKNNKKDGEFKVYLYNGQLDSLSIWENGKQKSITKGEENNQDKIFGQEYIKLEETILQKKSSLNEYELLKRLRNNLDKGITPLKELNIYIQITHKKYKANEIINKIEIYKELEHTFSLYLDNWETNQNTKFHGFEDVKQYHLLSQKIITELKGRLQHKW